MHKDSIDILVDYFLPGHKGGGVVRSVHSFLNQFSQDYSVTVITRDRDLGDDHAYPDVVSNQVNCQGAYNCYYVGPRFKQRFAYCLWLTHHCQGILYINSIFSWYYGILPLLLYKLAWIKPKKVIIAPRGELHDHALAQKSRKKNIFLKIAKLMRLHRYCIFQATTEIEYAAIRRIFPTAMIKVAREIYQEKTVAVTPQHKISGQLSMVWLSRIHPSKNVDTILRILNDMKGQIQLDIYGPVEDDDYWRQCQHLIAKLPENITVNYCGVAPAEKVSDIFASYDVFCFLTLGESFGYVILEALQAGCPVILSDKTPWQDIATCDAGMICSLHDSQCLIQQLTTFLHMDQPQLQYYRDSAIVYARAQLDSGEMIKQYQQLFGI